MSEFSDRFKGEYDITRENRENELEARILKDRIENRIRELELKKYTNIVEDKKIVEEIVKYYERLKYLEEEFDYADYEFQKYRLQILTNKQLEIQRKMHQDPSWAEFQEEELKSEGEERD